MCSEMCYLGLSKCVGSQLATVWGLFPSASPSPWSGTYTIPCKSSWKCPHALGKPGWNSQCNSCVSPGTASSAHLASVCVSFPLAGKLPSGFYCSFEAGDCGWMPGSSAFHPSPWRIGSPEHNRFPSREGV